MIPEPPPARVLLVDDKESGLLALAAVLESPAYRLVQAGSGREAVERLRSEEYAVVLLDVQMPDMDGFETARRIRQQERGKDVPILFITAIDQDSRYVHAGYDAGAVDYVFKPFDPYVLQSKVSVFVKLYESAMAQKRAEEALRAAQELLERKVQERTAELVALNSELKKEISIRAQVEGALRESEARFRTMADTVPAMVWMADSSGLFYYFNRAWVDFTERPREREVGDGWMERIHPEDLPRFQSLFRQAFASQREFTIEYRMKRFDGEYRWVLNTGIPRFTPDGEFMGYTGSGMDITHRKRAEQILLENEKTQKDLVANVSHDFRTPVAAIKGFAETLRRGAIYEPQNAVQFVKIIEKHAERLEWLVEDLLTLSTLESGLNSDPEAIPLRPFVEELIQAMEILIRKKDVTVRTRIAPDLCVQADRAQLHKLFQNLVTNCVKYNRVGGWVDISARVMGERLQVAVQDNGIGISKDHLPRIFDRFYRVHRNRVCEPGDTGLGLYIVKKIVESNGGDISVESVENQGSTFCFTLPLPQTGSGSGSSEPAREMEPLYPESPPAA